MITAVVIIVIEVAHNAVIKPLLKSKNPYPHVQLRLMYNDINLNRRDPTVNSEPPHNTVRWYERVGTNLYRLHVFNGAKSANPDFIAAIDPNNRRSDEVRFANIHCRSDSA